MLDSRKRVVCEISKIPVPLDAYLVLRGAVRRQAKHAVRFSSDKGKIKPEMESATLGLQFLKM